MWLRLKMKMKLLSRASCVIIEAKVNTRKFGSLTSNFPWYGFNVIEDDMFTIHIKRFAIHCVIHLSLSSIFLQMLHHYACKNENNKRFIFLLSKEKNIFISLSIYISWYIGSVTNIFDIAGCRFEIIIYTSY